MVPPSNALAPERWHTSRPTSAVMAAIGSRPISRSVDCTCWSGTTLRKGDCRNCNASASPSVSSNMVSPVRFTTDDSTTVSLAVNAGVVIDRYSSKPPTRATISSGAPTIIPLRQPGTGPIACAGSVRLTTCVEAAAVKRPDATSAGAATVRLKPDATLAVPLVVVAEPLSVARFRRFRSARSSAALW